MVALPFCGYYITDRGREGGESVAYIMRVSRKEAEKVRKFVSKLAQVKAKESKGMRTIFQTESVGEERLKGTVSILADGAVEEVFSLGEGLNLRRVIEAEKSVSVLIEVQDANKVVHRFVVTKQGLVLKALETGVDAGGDPFVIGQNNGGDSLGGNAVIRF